MASISVTRTDQYRLPSWSPAWRARRAFSPREAWKIQIDLDNEMVRSEEQRALPGLAGGSKPQVPAAFGGGVRLGGQQRLVYVSGFTAAGRCPAKLGAVGGLAFAEQQVVRLAIESSGLVRSRGPLRLVPTTGRAALPRSRWPGGSSWPRPWTGCGPPGSRCTPGHSPCLGSPPPPPANRPPAAAELSMLIGWCMGVKLEGSRETETITGQG
jgi:hypothetical protein